MKKKIFFRAIMIGLLLFLCFVFFDLFNVLYISSADVGDHNDFIIDLMSNKCVNFSHLGYHYTLMILFGIIGIDLKLLSIIFLTTLICIQFVYFSNYLKRFVKDYYAILISFSLVFANSIYNPLIEKVSNGQFGSALFHNPTYIYMKVLSLISVTYFFDKYNDNKDNYLKVFLVGLVMAFATFVKPNFSIVFFFGLFFLFLYDLYKKNYSKATKIAFFTAPSIFMLLYLFIFTFSQTSDSKIVFLPFVVWKIFVSSKKNIAIAVILTSLFPFLVTIFVYIKNKIISKELFVSWMATFCGIIQMAFFAESGPRMAHANFAWSLASGYSLLYLYSTIELLKSKLNYKIKIFLLLIALLHICSGIYYVLYLFKGGYAWEM